MRVIICGAGRVGKGIAARLASEGNTVTVVDLSQELIRQITTEYDVRGIVGHGAYPDMLARAGAESAEMIIAVTYSDEVNMMACQIAHSLFSVPTKVARVRAQNYLASEWNDLFSTDNMPIDVIISPEVEIGRSILRRINTPGAFDVVPFADGRVQLIGIRITEDTPIISTPLHQITDLFPDLHAIVVGIKRDGGIFAPTGEDTLNPGDEAYVITLAEHAPRLLEIIGNTKQKARQIVIIGGGNIGAYVAEQLEKVAGVRVRVIERDKARAEKAAESLRKTVILNGDAMDASIQEEAGVATAELVLCLTDDDKTNLLSAVLAKKTGAERTVVLVNEESMQGVRTELGVDLIVDPRATTVSSILRHVRRGRILDVFSIEEGEAEVMEGEVLETSPLAGKTIGSVEIGEGITIGAVIHDGRVIYPNGDQIVKPGDKLVLLAERGALKSVEQLFRVSMDYF
jgi:trk system potassium uptake protein TrkA